MSRLLKTWAAAVAADAAAALAASGANGPGDARLTSGTCIYTYACFSTVRLFFYVKLLPIDCGKAHTQGDDA